MINKDLLAIGHTALDCIITVDEFPQANSSSAINTMKNLNGGAAANVAMVASKMGLKTSLVSAVGGEFKDSKYAKEMIKAGVDISSMIVVEDETTPTAFVLTNDNKDQISYFYWGAGKNFKDSKTPDKSISESKAIHLATGDPDYNWKCSKEARAQEKLISFDPGQDLVMYSPERLKEVIGNINILFGNHYEIQRIQDSLNVDINGLRELGPQLVVKSCGEEGSKIYSDEGKIDIDAIYRPAVDPTGAGDSYRAAFLSKFLNGFSLEDCAKFASSVSSFIVEARGCQTNIPSFEDATSRMKNFY
ncbi:MAG: carbohydrate kinase family protein [Methanobacteriaceae archaeon]|nr:carbohydrate kinase family protein [Methanobacteriaceae archaeon]